MVDGRILEGMYGDPGSGELKDEYPDRPQNSPAMGKLRRRNAVSHIRKDADAVYWIWQLLSRAGLYGSVSGSDPHAMAVQSGKRDLGLSILADLMEASPDAYIEMQKRAMNGEFND